MRNNAGYYDIRASLFQHPWSQIIDIIPATGFLKIKFKEGHDVIRSLAVLFSPQRPVYLKVKDTQMLMNNVNFHWSS